MNQYSKTISKVGLITIFWNVLLSIGKIIFGIMAKTSSLISDGIHSMSDVGTTVIVMIGAKISSKEADDNHPFGHERLESITSIILAMSLGATAFILGYQGIVAIIDFCSGKDIISNDFIYLALGGAIASIVIKFIMFLYSFNVAKRINSTSLKADSYHHLSDSFSSIGSVLGIIGIMIGGSWSILDPIASIIIALFILKVAFDIAKSSIDQVVDKSAPKEFEEEIMNLCKSCEEVKAINSLKTRQFGNRYYVELEIAVNASLTVKEGHDIAKKIHDELETKHSNIKHCMIHIDPYI